LTTLLPKLKNVAVLRLHRSKHQRAEKSPQIQFVTFTALKAGGIVRVPSEIDADSAPDLGQFLARYVARESAKWEDTCGFLADGSGTYKTRSGICKTADTLGSRSN